MALKISGTLKKHITNIEKEVEGSLIKNALVNCISAMNKGEMGFKALTLNGHDISEFVTKEKVLTTFANENNQVYDFHPIKDSKKAVESGGYLDYFGDMNLIYRSITAAKKE